MDFKWLALPAALIATSPVLATDVLTFHNNPARTGLNDQETILTPSNVTQNTFGLLFNLPVDGKVDAQPLYISSIQIRGVGRKNVVIIATEHDSVYAFDADSGTLCWQISLLGDNEVPSDKRGCDQITPEIGISATPVITRESDNPGTIYLVAMSKKIGKTKTVYHQRLHALSLADGSETEGSPVEIEASFPGKGPGNDGSRHVIFNPADYKEAAALLIDNNVIYTTWASHCALEHYTGWIIGYHVSSLAKLRVLNVNPNGRPTSLFFPMDAVAHSGAAALDCPQTMTGSSMASPRKVPSASFRRRVSLRMAITVILFSSSLPRSWTWSTISLPITKAKMVATISISVPEAR